MRQVHNMPQGSCSWAERHFEIVSKRDGYEVFRKGWPNYVLSKDGNLLFVEVKVKGDPLRDSQKKMFVLLKTIGIEVKIAVDGELSHLLTIEEYQVVCAGLRGQAKWHRSTSHIKKRVEDLEAGRTQ